MSEQPRRRIRAQASTHDANVMSFVLDVPVQDGRSGRFERTDDAPLARALYALAGVIRVEVAEATISVRKDGGADWAPLKPLIAAQIRQVLDAAAPPLGADNDLGPDAVLLQAVEALLKREVNPAIAAHGGLIAAERVADGSVYLRMSGGCQGCAASAATLRQGVERMLRAALPQIREIVDVTDHAAGDSPFYAKNEGPSPALIRPVPPGVIEWDDGQVSVDPAYLAPRLGLTPQTLREGLRSGAVVGVTEAGEGADTGKTRIIMRSKTRAWAAEVLSDGSAREIPPPRQIGAAIDRAQDLANRVRAHLAALSPADAPVSYGDLARALGLWAPGSVGRITGALEATMREDAAAGLPFIAARTISRAREDRPGKGYFDLARALSRGPQDGESERDHHLREIGRLDDASSARTGVA
jgi:Fe-S cluster biogenesis protein NfuA